MRASLWMSATHAPYYLVPYMFNALLKTFFFRRTVGGVGGGGGARSKLKQIGRCLQCRVLWMCETVRRTAKHREPS
jgi:hypothetical protein